MIKKMGLVDVNKGWMWLKNLEKMLMKEKWNGKENCSGRLCMWFGLEVELGFKCSVKKGLEIGEGLKKRGNELWGGEDWNSVLVYKYQRGTELKEHIDREVFDPKVVIINFCKGLVGFKYGGSVVWLKDGEVVEINNRIKHGVLTVNEERWSVSFRKVL